MQVKAARMGVSFSEDGYAMQPGYAARLNSFGSGQSVVQLVAAAGEVGGIDAADLNYPDHFEGLEPGDLVSVLNDHGMVLNGLAMRYYGNRGFAIGALANPDAKCRREAIDLTKRGIDALGEMGGRLMTIWPGQDGVDYSFQGVHRRMWDDCVAALGEIADHNPDIEVAVEYKPAEPRAYALLPDAATTLLAIREAGRPNLGVTLDMAHSLMANEMPATSAHLISRYSRLLGVHLNDARGSRDDGLMVGTVHPILTLELFVELTRSGYEGVIYFDTFPDHSGLDPVEEARTNIRLTERLRRIAEGLVHDEKLADAMARQDAAASQRLIAAALYGA
ncbi:MAG: TIM barrel protein [Rhodobacteraceae bacterium]|nr:TIM barrel protein [Paracoccaceae bacterium]